MIIMAALPAVVRTRKCQMPTRARGTPTHEGVISRYRASNNALVLHPCSISARGRAHTCVHVHAEVFAGAVLEGVLLAELVEDVGGVKAGVVAELARDYLQGARKRDHEQLLPPGYRARVVPQPPAGIKGVLPLSSRYDRCSRARFPLAALSRWHSHMQECARKLAKASNHLCC